MQRLASVILGVVALFVVLVAVLMVAKSRTIRLESVGPAPANADLTVKQVEIEEEAGRVRWRLKADQALIFESQGRTNLKNVSVAVQEPDRSWTIVGREGDLFQPAKNLEIRGNVVVTSSDGTRLETSVLRWQNTERRLWTDVPVMISRDGRAVVHGHGLQVQMADEAMTVGGRVHATFDTARRDADRRP